MSLEQERAKHAWEKSKGCTDAFKSLAKGAPALIMTNGLMPSLAFWQTKKSPGDQGVGKRLVEAILQWLKKRKILETSDFSEAMEALYSTTSESYREATSETLEYLKWLRNFASANSSEEE